MPLNPTKSLCELRPGIGLCDECSLPKWPQKYVGYGFMVCLDCLAGMKPPEKERHLINQYVFRK